jgi:hypothetical protein
MVRKKAEIPSSWTFSFARPETSMRRRRARCVGGAAMDSDFSQDCRDPIVLALFFAFGIWPGLCGALYVLRMDSTPASDRRGKVRRGRARRPAQSRVKTAGSAPVYAGRWPGCRLLGMILGESRRCAPFIALLR